MRKDSYQIVITLNDEMIIDADCLIVKAKRFIQDNTKNESFVAIMKKKVSELENYRTILFHYSPKDFSNYTKDVKVIKEFFVKMGEIQSILDLHNDLMLG